jgi:hypothetical protein
MKDEDSPDKKARYRDVVYYFDFAHLLMCLLLFFAGECLRDTRLAMSRSRAACTKGGQMGHAENGTTTSCFLNIGRDLKRRENLNPVKTWDGR